MNFHPRRQHVCSAARASLIASLIAAGSLVGASAPARADAYQLTDIVTDDNTNLTSLGLPAAAVVDPNLSNPWGISFGGNTGPFWISDNNVGLTSLYR